MACPNCGAEEPIETLENPAPGVRIYLCQTCDTTWIDDNGTITW